MLRAPPCRMCILPAASRVTRFSFIRYSDWIKGYLKKAAFFIFQLALCFEAARNLLPSFPLAAGQPSRPYNSIQNNMLHHI